MPEYRYKAARMDGTTVRGKMTAQGAHILKEQLQNENLFLIKCSEIVPRRIKLNSRRLYEISYEISAMLTSGIVINKALRMIAEREKSPEKKRAFEQIVHDISKGASIQEAFSAQCGMFPTFMLSMMAAGEKNGKMAEAFARISEYFEKEHRLRSEIRAALTYPLILLVITALVVIVIFTVVFPMFMQLLEGAELPLITRIMMGISELLTKYLPFVLIGVAALAVIIFYISGLPGVRLAADKAKLKLPLFGKSARLVCTSRFARTFAFLYSGGIFALDALELSTNVVGNRYIIAQAENVFSQLKSGAGLTEAISKIDGFDSRLADSCAIGESSGRLSELLIGMSDSIDHELSLLIKRQLKLAEPVMIFIMAVIILLVVLSVMLPIYDMYSHLGRM